MNLFIGNLNPQTNEESLRTLFSEFGEILSIKIPVDAETGMPRGFGFVEMSDKFEGYDAIDNIDGTYFEGQVITVKESKPKGGAGGRRGPGGGGGFRRGGNNHRGGGGGFRRSYGNDRGDGGGYRSRDNDGGGYRSRDNDGGGYRRSDDNGGYRRSEDGNGDVNRQPGRRFSPRGPRPGND